MDMKVLIDECRHAFAAAASARAGASASGSGGGGGGGFFGLFKKSPPARGFQRDCGLDDDVGLIESYRILYEHGRVVWGSVAQANNMLFSRGNRDLPANTVFSTDPYFDGAPDVLETIAHEVFAVKNTSPDDPEVAKIAAMITDEYNRAQNIPLPPQITRGRAVMFTSTWVHRRRIPTGYLVDGTFPLLVAPERTPHNMILPLAYWSPALVKLWREADARVPEDVKNAPEHDLPAMTWEAYSSQPVHLTPLAAAEVRKIIGEQGLNPAAYLWVGIRREGGGFLYDLDVRENAAPPNTFATFSHGIPVVVDPFAATYLAGTRIDLKNSPQGKGFVFNNPNVQPR